MKSGAINLSKWCSSDSKERYQLPKKTNRVIDNLSPGGITFLMMVSVCVMIAFLMSRWSSPSPHDGISVCDDCLSQDGISVCDDCLLTMVSVCVMIAFS